MTDTPSSEALQSVVENPSTAPNATETPKQTTPPAAPVHLALKICAIMTDVERLPKNGYNDFHKYHYVMEADVTDTLRRLMAAQHVVVFPALDRVEHQGDLTTVYMRFTLVDADSGESLVIPWQGQGQDKNDKGISKAITAATKYMLLKTFQLSAGDDPEADTNAGRGPATLKARNSKRNATAPTTNPVLPTEPFLARITQGAMEQKTTRDGDPLLFFRGHATVVDTGETFALSAWRTNAQVLEIHRKQQQPVLVQGTFHENYAEFQVKTATPPKPQAVPSATDTPPVATSATTAEAIARAPQTAPIAEPATAPNAPGTNPEPAVPATSAPAQALPTDLKKELWAQMKQAKLSPTELIAFANTQLKTSVEQIAQLSVEQIQTVIGQLQARAS